MAETLGTPDLAKGEAACAGGADTAAGAAPLRVLVVDDDPAVGEVLAARLERDGFAVTSAGSAAAALHAIESDGFALVVLDLALPDRPGMAILNALRARGARVIVLTGAGGVAERIAGLRQGADDFVVKPCNLDEFAARVAAVLRRSDRARTDELYGPSGVVVRPAARQLLVGGVEVQPSRTQFALMVELLRHRGEVLTPEVLSLRVWGHSAYHDRNYIEAQISRLRALLRKAGAPAVITTVRGVGYTVR